ncbi:hypothetical protein Droror1_Dr00026803 [Drosera rotundifolia]
MPGRGPMEAECLEHHRLKTSTDAADVHPYPSIAVHDHKEEAKSSIQPGFETSSEVAAVEFSNFHKGGYQITFCMINCRTFQAWGLSSKGTTTLSSSDLHYPPHTLPVSFTFTLPLMSINAEAMGPAREKRPASLSTSLCSQLQSKLRRRY